MSLVVNHNMMAANVANNLNGHYGKLATSTQRLSTGLRINSAADDAAGLLSGNCNELISLLFIRGGIGDPYR